VAKAGTPIQLIFENTDMMPHNIVFAKPGAMEEIGLAAELAAQQPDAIQRHYVPQSPNVILHSQLIQPGQSQSLELNVPDQPGIYPYVCTYPGHWRRMFGSMIVVDDPRAYQLNAQQYLKNHQIEYQDPLLKLNLRGQTEWKLADLQDAFDGVSGEFMMHRNWVNGQQLFKLASCVSCHQINGEGYPIGPDLATKLDPKWTAVDILQSIIEPSIKIDDQYKTRVFALISGETISGVVIEEDGQQVKLVENPLLQGAVKIIAKDEIEDQKTSEVSIMPKGLLDALSREEILDLIAFVVAKGDANHPLYKGSQ
jgi:putative heme-binding domain-containing protein